MVTARDELPPDADVERGYALSGTRMFLDMSMTGDVFQYERPDAKAIDEMLKQNGKARGLEGVLTLPLRQCPITIEPDRADVGGADLVRDILTRPANSGGMTTPLEQVQAQLTSGIIYRRAYFEKVFRTQAADGGPASAARRATRVGLHKLAFRNAITCLPRFDKRNMSFDGFSQDPKPGETGPDTTKRIVISPEKSLVYTYGAYLRPETGVSDLEIAYWCHETKKKILFLWAQYLEATAMPRTVVKAKDEAQAGKFARLIGALKSSGVVGLPSRDAEISVLDVSGKGAVEFQAALNWLDSQASQSVLAGFTDLTTAANSGTGSYALSKDQTDFFLMSRQAIARELSATLTTYVAADLVKYNLGPDSPVPRIVVGPVGEADITASLSLLETIIAVNEVTPPDEFVRGLLGLVARAYGMNEQTVSGAMTAAATGAARRVQNAPESVAKVAATAASVNAAATAVQQARAAQAGTPRPGGV